MKERRKGIEVSQIAPDAFLGLMAPGNLDLLEGQ
jgi:hypothetical protein